MVADSVTWFLLFGMWKWSST